MVNSPDIRKEIVISSERGWAEGMLPGNEIPGVLFKEPQTEHRTFANKGEYASELVYQRSSLIIDTTTQRVLVALRGVTEPQGVRLISGTSILISNIRDKVGGIDWSHQSAWNDVFHILKKNDQGGGYLFGVEVINGVGIIDKMTSNNEDTVRPATIEEMLGILETEKPLEYKLLRSIEGMEFGTVTGTLD